MNNKIITSILTATFIFCAFPNLKTLSREDKAIDNLEEISDLKRLSTEENVSYEPKYEPKIERRSRLNYQVSSIDNRGEKRKGLFTNRAAGTRNSELSERNRIVIIAPNTYATTISSHPTFYFKAPRANMEISVLIESTTGIIFEKKIAAKRGMNKISLPEDTKGLVLDENYKLVVTEVISQNDPTKNVSAQVWLFRTELNSIQNAQLANLADPEQQAIFLANNGIWYDAVARLIPNKESKELLDKLLTQGGLEALLN